MRYAIDILTELDYDLIEMSDEELHAFAIAASIAVEQGWQGSGRVAEIARHPGFGVHRQRETARLEARRRHGWPSAA